MPRHLTQWNVSIGSRRLTPLSALVTIVRSTPSAVASSCCVILAFDRASRSRAKKTALYFSEWRVFCIEVTFVVTHRLNSGRKGAKIAPT